MAPTTKAMPPTRSQDKFAVEKTIAGDVTFLTLRGTLDHAFEGKKVASLINTRKVVVSLRHTRRFASWGMTEWMDFLRINASRDVYIVECSTYAMSQINLVTGLLGHAKLVSFYASYRCGSCSEEHENLFLIPRDRDSIRDLPGSQQECTTCGGRARLEEYPAAFFDKIAERPSFDIDDEALAFMRSHLNYPLAPDLSRFRALRRVQKDYTYLRLSGNLAALPAETLAAATEGAAVVDLGAIVFEQLQLSGWRTYVQAAMAKTTSLQLLNCPLGFLELAVEPDDLRDKLKIRTFALSYDCLRCQTTTPYMVDVAEHLEQLVEGVAPPAPCPACGSSLLASPSIDQAAIMRCLPARDRDPVLDKFLATAIAEPPEKLENCLAALPARGAVVPGPSKRMLYVALGLSIVVIGALVGVTLVLWKKDPAPVVVPGPVIGGQGPTVPAKPAFQRPEWILTDAPGTGYCHDLINRLMCVGVSSYRAARDEAVAEANDAALEELVSAVGLKITEPFFRDGVVAGYSGVRSKALAALQGELEQGSGADAAAAAAVDLVTKTRRRVVEAFRSSGGPAVPTQRSDWYWEEYSAKKGGTETLVFIRYDVSNDAVKALVEKYATQATILGSTAITAFPALAWQYADFTGGVVLMKVGRPLSDAGVTAPSLLAAVGDKPVADTAALSRRLEEWKHGTGDLKLLVKTDAVPSRTVELKRPR